MFKVTHDLCPEQIKNLFDRANNRTRSNAQFHRPHINTVRFGEQSFRAFGPIVWDNMLPSSFKEISTIEEFKAKVKELVPSNCV